ncbi:MAG: hypothetical protein JF626_05250, partial [Polaromonas sp.]|nr:hypothetical protein [Polaromonas sp.]
ANGSQQTNIDVDVPSSSDSEYDASNSSMGTEHRAVGWKPWVREGLRANILLPIRELPAGPSALQMLCIVGVITALITSLLRYEITGAATFSLRSWLFGWATTGLLIAGIWLIITGGRKKSSHASPVAA